MESRICSSLIHSFKFIFISGLSLILLAYYFSQWRFLISPSTPNIPTFTQDPIIFSSLLPSISLENATAVFNTIQGALRNKDAQIQPIGVSFIPAIIPEGTLMYHGNTDGNVPAIPEWIALDYEFSYSFISNRGRPRNGTDGPRHRPGHKAPPPSEMAIGPIIDPVRPKWEYQNDHPTLLTFEVLKPLDKMILLDGSSAAKTDTGEMDQQMILAGVPFGESINERDAARRICEWGKPFGLDGFIRIEVGYEAVICDLQTDKIRVIYNETISWDVELFEDEKFAQDKEFKEYLDAFSGYDYIRQGSAHDKREGRILLDYRGFITPINRTWINPDTYRRRIHNISQDIKCDMISELESFFHKKNLDAYIGTDWQLITTEIVDKFSPLLKIVNDTYNRVDYENEEDFNDNVRNLTLFTANFAKRFLDNTTPLSVRYEIAKRQAIYHYSHPLKAMQTSNEVLIWTSITKVTECIVDIIFETFVLGKDFMGKKVSIDETHSRHKEAAIKITELLNTLQWTAYYRCSRQCGWDEVCYTPSWGPSPMGWGASTVGTYIDSEGRIRISQEEQCINYKTVADARRGN